MRKILVLVVAEIMIAAGGFLTEYLWPAGDLRWAYVLLTGAVLIPLLYSPEIWRFILRQASKASKPARPLGKPSSEQDVSPDHTGTITINHNDGDYSIGEGKHKFVIHWSPHNHDTVYLYKVGERGHMVLMTDDDKKFDKLVIGEGQKAGYQNGHGNWATIEIINVEHKKGELEFCYAIMPPAPGR